MTTEASSDRKRDRLPRYKRAETPPRMVLTERDQEIIRWVYELRFATQEQLQNLLFSSKTASSCKRRLTLLYHNGFLDRRLLPLRSGFGANRAAYCLDRRGADVLAPKNGTGESLDWRTKDNDRELLFLEHTLATNDVHIAALLSARQQGWDLTWINERALRSRTMRDIVDDPKNAGEKLAVIPDGYFQLQTDGKPLGFAVELDRATVEEKRFKAKVRALGEWKVTGSYQKRFGTESLRVLFVVTESTRDPGRLERIKQWTEAEGGLNLFWFAKHQALSPSGFFTTPLWQVAGRDGLYPLFG